MSAKRAGLKVSNKAKIVSNVAVRRWEGTKYLRADAEPNWSQRIKEKEGDITLIASKPAVTITSTSTVLEAVERMYEKRVRGLVVVDSSDKLKGTIMATDVVNYLGGGSLYTIVEQRHGRDIFGALRSEKVESIMNPTPLYATVSSKISETLKLMVLNGMGLVPIVAADGTPYGVVTEHDIVRYLVNKDLGIKVKDVMTSNLVVTYESDTIKRAAQLMSLYGFRRVPVLSADGTYVVGIVSAMDFIAFFGSHEALKKLSSYDVEEVLSTKVSDIMSRDVVTTDEDEDVGAAASIMNSHNTNSLIVVDKNNEVKGIITERDILLSVALR
jgi:CBS domain-containing protein